MRLRVPEINQNTVTHVSSDESVEPGHEAPDDSMKCGNDFSDVFGIDPLSDRRRADKVNEHDAQQPAFRRRRGDGLDCIVRGPARSTAVAAEPFVGRIVAAAGAALPRQRRSAVAAELPVVRDGGAATPAYHARPQPA